MAFLSIDRERYFYLLSFGTQEGELKKFFTDSHKQLLLKGAKIQNLPHARQARIRAMVERLPSSTDEVVRSWFQKNLAMLDPMPVSELLDEFNLYESVGDRIPEDQASRLARSCLKHLVEPHPPHELLAFLRTSVGDEPSQESPELDVSVPIESTVDVSRPVLVELLADALEDGELGDILDELPTSLGTYVEGLMATRRSDLAAAQRTADSLPPDSQEHQFLIRSIKRARGRSKDHTGGGIQVHTPVQFARDFDSEHDSIVAYCTTAKANATFVQPIGCARSGRLELLSRQQSMEFFPETGDVMAFGGQGRPRQPKRGEIGLWKVAEHSTDKSTRFHIAEEVASVYEVVKVPFHSSEADSVREFIKQYSRDRKEPALQRNVFLLTDGPAIAPKERVDLVRDDSYEAPFYCWSRLDANLFEGRLLILGPLPEPTSLYDCAPIASAVKQLVRSIKERGTSQLTKAQQKEIIATVQAEDVGIARQRLARIVNHLDRAVEDEAAIEEMLSIFMEHQSVRARIDQRVDEVVAARVSERDVVVAEIERLSKDKASLEQRIRQLSEQHRKIGQETAGVVKGAFDKAVANGLEELAKVEIFNALVGPRSEASANQQGSSSPAFASRVLEGCMSDDDMIKELRHYGIDRRFAIAIVASIRLASACGVLVFIKGAFARPVSKIIAAGLGARISLVEVPIGIINPADELLVSSGVDSDVLLLLDANHSDISLYAPELTERLLSTRARKPIFLASLSQSLIALPIPEAIERLSITIDLDWSVDFHGGVQQPEVTGLLSGAVPERASLFRPALEQISEKLVDVQEAHRNLVAVILVRALSTTSNEESVV